MNLALRSLPTLAFLLAAGNVCVLAEVIEVGGSAARFTSIREAIVAAGKGDTIRVLPGTYEEDLLIDKQLVVEGVGDAIVRGSGQTSVITVVASGCEIRGLTIENSGKGLEREDSGILLKSDGNRIEGNTIRDVLFGIYLFQSNNNDIRGNAITGRRHLSQGDRGSGLHLWFSSGNAIEKNVISDARDGIYIQSSNENSIRGNRVFDLRYGLHYMFSDDNAFEDNQFLNNVAGAAIMYSKRIRFRRNAFIHNRGYSSFGILLQNCDDSLAEENFIVNNATGIFLEAVRGSTFRANTVAENDLALKVFASASENLFHENRFVGNLSPLQVVGRVTSTTWHRDGRGNYWSDYTGYDLDGDGIGDVPHRVQDMFEYMEGNHPRLRLYLSSPAAQALATAEELFPLIRGSSEIDPYPLMQPPRLAFPFEQARPSRRVRVAGVLVSSVMLLCAGAVVWRGRRR